MGREAENLLFSSSETPRLRTSLGNWRLRLCGGFLLTPSPALQSAGSLSFTDVRFPLTAKNLPPVVVAVVAVVVMMMVEVAQHCGTVSEHTGILASQNALLSFGFFFLAFQPASYQCSWGGRS